MMLLLLLLAVLLRACLVPDREPLEGDYAFGLLMHEWAETLEQPRATIDDVLAIIRERPGIWAAQLCRLVNGLDDNRRSVAYCGTCRPYANQRKRNRNDALLQNLPLPGFGRPAKVLHEACPFCDFGWLRGALFGLRRQGQIVTIRQRRFDWWNHRGWDWMYCNYAR